MSRPIWHLIVGLGQGGAEQLLADVLPRQRAAGLQAQVVALKRTGALLGTLRERGVPVRMLGGRGRADPRPLWRLRRAFLREQPRLVHAHLARAIVAAHLAIGTRAPVERIVAAAPVERVSTAAAIESVRPSVAGDRVRNPVRAGSALRAGRAPRRRAGDRSPDRQQPLPAREAPGAGVGLTPIKPGRPGLA